MSFKIKIVIVLLSFICFSQKIKAQSLSNIDSLWKYGVEAGSILSFTGVNLRVNFLMIKNKNEFYIGPKLAISDSYLPLKGPWGLSAGYRRNVLEKERWKSFVNLDYQIVFIKPYNPRNLEVNGINTIQELFIAYGFEFRIAKDFTIGQLIGGGGFLEKTIDVSEGKTNRIVNYSGLLSFFVNYTF